MSFLPIAKTTPQYMDGSGDPYSGAVLKAYAAGTATNISMATDTAGGTTFTSVALNSNGYPENGGATIIPHVDQDYKLSLYPTQAAADANSGAIWTIDNLPIIDFSTYFTDTETGTGDAYEVSITGVTSYLSGTRVQFVASEANVGACTLNINALGAKSIKLLDGTDPYNNAVVANQIVDVMYDGTDFQLLNPSIAGTEVTGYVRGVTEYVESDVGADSTNFNFSVAITQNTWESVGPTGSGAANIWTTLDSVPTGAKWIEILSGLRIDGSTNGDTYNMYIAVRKTGSSTTGNNTIKIRSQFINRSGAQERASDFNTFKVPVDASLRFDLLWVASGTSIGYSTDFYLVGWGM